MHPGSRLRSFEVKFRPELFSNSLSGQTRILYARCTKYRSGEGYCTLRSCTLTWVMTEIAETTRGHLSDAIMYASFRITSDSAHDPSTVQAPTSQDPALMFAAQFPPILLRSSFRRMSSATYSFSRARKRRSLSPSLGESGCIAASFAASFARRQLAQVYERKKKNARVQR